MSNPFIIQKKGKLDLNDLYINSDVYLYPYARNAFLEILKVMSIKTIYLPAFICRDMLAPINVLDIKYFFYDVDKKLNPLLNDIECDAILTVNYFGFAGDFSPFIKYKEKYGSLIIEDNAHGFLSRDSSGTLLGTRGDVGLLSIRKTIFLPNGAALLINDSGLKKRAFQSAEIKESFEDINYSKKLNLKKFLVSKYLGMIILLLRRLVRYIQTGDSIPPADKLSETQMPDNKYLTPLLNSSTLNIDMSSEVIRRQELYQLIEGYADSFDIKPIFKLNDFSVPFEFSFIDDGKSDKFEKYLFQKGFFILPWPDLADEVLNHCPNTYKNIKVVPFLW